LKRIAAGLCERDKKINPKTAASEKKTVKEIQAKIPKISTKLTNIINTHAPLGKIWYQLI
jgi:hypothetical protein